MKWRIGKEEEKVLIQNEGLGWEWIFDILWIIRSERLFEAHTAIEVKPSEKFGEMSHWLKF